MTLQYELINGSYYLFDADEKPSVLTKQRDIRLMTDTVAICFDRESGTLLKHGNPEQVEAWAAAAAKKFRAAGFDDMANGIVVISGAFPVEEINKCLTTSGYCAHFMEKLSTMLPTKVVDAPSVSNSRARVRGPAF